MMRKIIYLLSNDTEPDVRLSDAMLYAALSEALGDQLEPVDIMSLRHEEDILWGKDPFQLLHSRIDLARSAYQDPAVQAALESKIVDYDDVQSEMDRARDEGYGVILRNMRNPGEKLRYCARGDRFESHASAINAERAGYPILISRNRNLSFVRRYLVVAGAVAAETPYRYCTESPTELLNPDAWKLQAEDFMSPLSEADPVWLDMQRAEADRLLSDFPLLSGAIDIGLEITADGWVNPKVESVISAPPGAFLCFHADPHLYASAISRNLELLEPPLRETEGLNL